MISVLIKTDSHFTVDRDRIRKTVTDVLNQKGVKGKIEVSISIVGDRMMRMLNKKYRNIDATTDVLSFPLAEDQSAKPFIDPPDNMLRLGDIIVSYPQAVDDASEDDKMVDDKMDELIAHGMLHLLGVHHD